MVSGVCHNYWYPHQRIEHKKKDTTFVVSFFSGGGGALRELEKAGYIVRRQLRGPGGRISDTEYTIYEKQIGRASCRERVSSPV